MLVHGANIFSSGHATTKFLGCSCRNTIISCCSGNGTRYFAVVQHQKTVLCKIEWNGRRTHFQNFPRRIRHMAKILLQPVTNLFFQGGCSTKWGHSNWKAHGRCDVYGQSPYHRWQKKWKKTNGRWRNTELHSGSCSGEHPTKKSPAPLRPLQSRQRDGGVHGLPSLGHGRGSLDRGGGAQSHEGENG